MTLPALLEKLTDPQRGAVQWLKDRNGEGVWDKKNRFIAAGEIAPIMNHTWVRLEKAGCIVRNGKRMTLTPLALQLPWFEPPECKEEEETGIRFEVPA